MSMTQQAVSFLKPDTEQIRHQIRGIIDSYSHEWDVLAELAQNSIDAINQANPSKGHIEITIDAHNRELTFKDNGTGIDPADISKLLRPFGSSKFNNPNQIGSKGVGLTFILFTTSFFRLETHNVNGSAAATVVDAKSWVQSSSDELLPVKIEEITKSSQGTILTLRFPDDAQSFWSMTLDQIVFWLRTKTAIGDTRAIWGFPFNCDTKLLFKSASGQVYEREFECQYMLPIEFISEIQKIDLEAYFSWRNDGDRSDIQKRQKLANKIVYHKEQKFVAGREIRMWSCFVPSRSTWSDISSKAALTQQHTDAETENEFEGIFGGLFTSSKGMPTGIQLPMKTGGQAGYLPNFFIIIEDPLLSFDIGRKAIQTRQQGVLKNLAAEQFNQYLQNVAKYVGGAIDTLNSEFDKDQIFHDIDQLPELVSNKTTFQRRPNGQEASVAAMFYELLGKGTFPDLVPMVSGYKGKYDLFAKLKYKRKVIEFKYDLSGLLRDFDDTRKMFSEIDVLVVWEITEKDRTLASKRGIQIVPIHESTTTGMVRMPGAQNSLSIDYVSPIDIVEIKTLLEL
jgi:molecular chaperone HtpG